MNDSAYSRKETGRAFPQLFWKGAFILLLFLGMIRWHPVLFSSLYTNLGNIELIQMISRPEADIRKAVTYFMSALAWDARNARSYANLGQAYVLQGKYDAAIQAYYEAVADGDPDPITYYRLGEAYMTIGEVERGVQQWRKAVGTSIDDRIRIANRLISKGFVDQGIVELKLALDIPGISDSGRFGVYRMIAEVDTIQGREPAEAQFYAEQALKIAPNDALSHRWLAWALYMQNEFPQAIAEANRAISLGDTHAATYEVLGRACLASGYVDQAIEALEVSVAQGPWIFAPQFELGQAYLKKGMRQQAIIRFKKVLEIWPDCAPAREALEQLGCKPPACN